MARAANTVGPVGPDDPTGGEKENVPAPVPVGLNKPLRIVIKDVFTGDCDPGECLITTAVKSSATYEARPLAIQATHKVQESRAHLPFRAAEAGSPVVYYTGAALDREVTVDVRMDFDRFDLDRYNKYIDLIAKAGSLPVFAGAGLLGGAVGVGTAAAAIYAGKTGAKVIARAFDRWRDRSNTADLYSTFTVSLDSIEALPTQAGYYLCWNDASDFMFSPDGSWQDAVIAGDTGSEFTVDDKGLLRYQDGRRVNDVDRGYVLLHISGAEDSSLKKYEPTAATAALITKFIDGGGSFVEDFTELATAYNDFVFLRRIADLDERSAASTDDAELAKLKAERAAVLQHIQTDEVKDLVKL